MFGIPNSHANTTLEIVQMEPCTLLYDGANGTNTLDGMHTDAGPVLQVVQVKLIDH